MQPELRDELTKRGSAAAERLVELVASLDADQATRAVPGMAWTATDVAAHVVTLYGRALGDNRRSATAAGTAELNEQCLREIDERDPGTLADRIAADAATVWQSIFPMIPDDMPLAFHAGATSTIQPIMGVVLLEMLVHGDDIARAVETSFEIDESDAWLVLEATCPLFAAFRRPDVPSVDDVLSLVDQRDDSRAIRIVEHNGVIDAHPGAAQPGDRTTVALPSDLLLGALGRRPSGGVLADFVTRYGPF